MPTTPPPNAMTPASTVTGSSSCERIRISVTGFHVYVSSLEPAMAGLDGRGDEVYAATTALIWNRKSQTTTDVKSARSSDYGDVGTAGMWPTRIKAGNLTNEGGISSAQGAHLVSLQTPMVVWDGTLTDDDVLFVLPTLWEKDVDASFYNGWRGYWENAPQWFFSNNTIQNAVLDPTLKQLLNPVTIIGTPVTVPLQDLTANVRDHPIGTEPQPLPVPITGLYKDRVLIVTRQKVAGLNAGAPMNVTVNYAAMGTAFAREHYALNITIERLP
jgi:hypothetical protein